MNKLREARHMKKLSNPLLAALLLTEIIVILPMTGYIEKYPVFLVFIVVLAVIAGVTIYFFVRNIVDSYAEQRTVQNEQFENYKFEFSNFKTDCLEMIQENNDVLEHHLKQIIDCQKKYSSDTEEAYSKLAQIFNHKSDEMIEKVSKEYENTIIGLGDIISDSSGKISSEVVTVISAMAGYTKEINECSIKQFGLLTDKFAEQSAVICAKTNENADILGSTVHNEMKDVLESIRTLMNQFSEQINNTKTSIEQVIMDVKNALDDQIKETGTNTANLQNSMNETFHSGMDDVNRLLTSMQTVFDTRLSDVHIEYEQMLADVKAELVNHTERVSNSVSENTRILSENINHYSENVSVGLQHIWKENIDTLNASCETFLSQTSETLKVRNLELMDAHTDYSHERIKEIAEQYDQIMNIHVANLKNEVQECISEFIKVNCNAFEQNARNVAKLVGSEDKFIGELTANNEKMNTIVTEGFNQYTLAVIDMIRELENKLAQNITDGTTVSKEHISAISEHNKTIVNELAEKLCSYADNIVDKSAQAIANVQSDNNRKLQEMCDSYIDFSRDSRIFAENCSNNNLQINNSIKHLMEQNREFLVHLQQVSDGNVVEMGKVLNDYADHMSQRIEQLNKDNSNRYNNAMEEYRDSFVKLNADALANVQSDNIDAISNAHSKLAELADMLQKTDERMNRLGKVFVSTLESTKKVIDDGNQTASEQQEDFNDSFDENISNMKKIFSEKLSEYNSTFIELNNRINVILEEIHKNTESYNDTLKVITDSQKAMNSLTSKDVQLLEKLIRG